MANEIYRSYEFGLEKNLAPIAVILPAEQEAIVGSIVKLDGTASIDPEDLGLTYIWRFSQVPIGSQVERFGFTSLETNRSIVSFAPDITGPYVVELVVSDGSLSSDPVVANIDVRIILVPYHKGYVPDASFIWNYLSDFWNRVDGKEKFEVFWSSAIQIVSAEMLKLYQYDYNKSIRDIQEVFQRRWLSFESGLLLNRDQVKFVLANNQAGLLATTLIFDPKSGAPSVSQPSYTEQIAVPFAEGNISLTSSNQKPLSGRLLTMGQRSFSLSRSASFTVSLLSDTDGKVTVGTNRFTGSGFTSQMVGHTLRVLGAVTGVSKDWKIATVTSGTEVTVVSTSDVAPSFPATVQDLLYSVLAPKETHSVFVADQSQVPAGLENQPWRFGSTLISLEHDYEAQGVSPGDLLEIEIIRLDLGLSGTFFAQVVGVDRNRLAFVLNLEDLVDGEAAGGLTDDIQATLAADLRVTGLGVDPSGKLLYSNESRVIDATTHSQGFKRQYYETELTPYDEIDLGAFKIQARPVQVIRNKSLPVDPKLVSVPMLQEYVRHPQVITENDKTYLLIGGKQREVTREPYILAENLDYVVDDESKITGSCEVTAGSDEIIIPFGDLIDRSVEEQDLLQVTIGYASQNFEIRRVLGPDRIRVHPTPNNTSVGALFTLTRRVKGKFLRFITGRFSKKFPAPKRLWAEVVYFDNTQAIEDNFGVLVGLTREDIERASSGIPYKSAVAGLMYALSNGPTIANLELAAHILLGMPFTQAAGVIKEINQNYRLREDGSTRFGRILIEGRDDKGAPTGLTYIYSYLPGRQKFDIKTETWGPAVSNFSGLGINPKTGLEFAVGDEVAQFIPLARGIEIQEYLITPEWSQQLLTQGNIVSYLQRYHTFQLILNSDIVSASDIDLTAHFLKKAKAHYVRLISALLKSLEEDIEIVDLLYFGRQVQFYDSVGHGLPSAMKFDQGDENMALLTFGGTYYTRYASGDDLVTTRDFAVVTSAQGGFIDPRIVFAEAWDPPLLRVGDMLVIFAGTNAGQYRVQAVSSDTELYLDLESDQNFVTAVDQLFAVYRPLRNPIWSGKATVTKGDGLVSTQETVGVQGGIGASGVMVGDILVFTNPTLVDPSVSQRYTIVRVVPDPVSPYIVVVPDPVETTAVYDAWVIREALMSKGIIAAEGALPSTFWVSAQASQPFFTFANVPDFQNDWLNVSLLRYGDLLLVGGQSYMVLEFDALQLRVAVSPTPSQDVDGAAAIITLRPDRGTTPLSFDFLDRIPQDSLQLELQASSAYAEEIHTVNHGTDVVSTAGVNFEDDMNAVPGDFLVILEGSDSIRDVGHGVGAFLILQVLGTSLRLVSALTSTGDFRYGIRRRVPNEG